MRAGNHAFSPFTFDPKGGEITHRLRHFTRNWGSLLETLAVTRMVMNTRGSAVGAAPTFAGPRRVAAGHVNRA
jgi:hypothetical protein